MVTSSSIKALLFADKSSVIVPLSAPACKADWGIDSSAKLAINVPSTCKSPLTDKSSLTDISWTVNLLFVEPMNISPPSDRSFATNNLFLIVTSSSINALLFADKSKVIVPLVVSSSNAERGIEPSAKVATKFPSTCKSPFTDAFWFIERSWTIAFPVEPVRVISEPTVISSDINKRPLNVVSSVTNKRLVVEMSSVNLLASGPVKSTTAVLGMELLA